MERFGHHAELREFAKWLQGRDDWDGDAILPCFLHKTEVFLVVEKHLCDGIVGTQVLLALENLHVVTDVGCFLVLFGIASHTEGERTAWLLDGCSVNKETIVELIHLFDEFCGVGISSRSGLKARFVLCLVAAKEKQVLDAEELEVEQHVFDVFLRESAAHHVRHHLDVVLVHDGRCYGYCARTTAQARAFEAAVGLFVIHVFAAVSRDVDVFRTELLERINGAEQTVCSVSFQRWKDLEGKTR